MTNGSRPAISICIPTYNGARHIAACLTSALAQSAPDVEILVNDDGSTDDTVRIAHEFAQRDRRIRVHENETNLGLVANWNRTIDKAAAPWIKLLFQDDLLHAECTTALHALCTSAGLKFAACLRDILFDQDVSPHIRDWFDRHAAWVSGLFDEAMLPPERVARICLDHFALNFVGEPTVTLFHRSVFDEVGYFDESLSQRVDTEMWYRAGLRYGVGMVRRPLATFRFHGGSTSAQNLASRKFVDEQLDPLIIRYRCLFDDDYSILRDVAGTQGVAEMKRLLDAQIEHALRLAQQDLANGNAASMIEWRRVVAAYPDLEREPSPAVPGGAR